MSDIKEYMYILDYSDCSFNELELSEEENDMDTEDILKKHGFNYNECYVMFTTNRITEINKIH